MSVSAALFVFTASWFGSWLLGRLAGRLHMVDVPNQRSSHRSPTARGAGLAIAASASVALWTGESQPSPVLPTLLASQAMVAGIGLLDDVFSLPSLVRLGVHTLAALAVTLAPAVWPVAPAGAPVTAEIACGAVCVFWIVGLTNAYNFMDGIDGIAGVQGVVAGLGWSAIGWQIGDGLVSSAGLAVAAGCGGFLLRNWPPARIFMGDVGSGYLGFTFASLTLLALRRDPLLGISGILLVWPFLVDTAFTLVRRLLRGENVLLAHRSHVYQRLVGEGISHRTVTLLYGSLAALGGVAAVALAASAVAAAALVVGVQLVLTCSVYVWLRRLEAGCLAAPARR